VKQGQRSSWMPHAKSSWLHHARPTRIEGRRSTGSIDPGHDFLLGAELEQELEANTWSAEYYRPW
jgi:hypothetical protein